MFYASEWGSGKMPQGLQIFKANGDLALDVTDRLTTVLGEFDTGFGSGSLYHPGLSYGKVWHHTTMYDKPEHNGTAFRCLHITANGNTLTWENRAYSCDTKNYHVIFGVC